MAISSNLLAIESKKTKETIEAFLKNLFHRLFVSSSQISLLISYQALTFAKIDQNREIRESFCPRKILLLK